MIPSVLPNLTRTMPATRSDEATRLAQRSARLQCALYFELLRLAGRVLRQYSREHLSQP